MKNVIAKNRILIAILTYHTELINLVLFNISLIDVTKKVFLIILNKVNAQNAKLQM